MQAIKTDNLTKRYGDCVTVDRLNLSVASGELFALLGINGAGKTTTIKMLCGLAKPTGGDAFLLGKSILRELMEAKGMIGVSPQETAVAPNLSVRENLELMCGVHGLSSREIGRRVQSLLSQFSLTEVAHRRAGKLSGGWQRRVSIAMALITEPAILFLDEPTLGLDVLAREELWELIRSLRGKTTIVLTTHYLEEAQALADRIGIMSAGRLRVCGTAQELMELAGRDSFQDAFIHFAKEGSQ